MAGTPLISRHRGFFRMARPESVDRAGIVKSDAGSVSQHQHLHQLNGRRQFPSGTFSHSSQAKRIRLDPTTANKIKQELMRLWKSKVHLRYPDFDKTTYLIPPLHFNRVLYQDEIISDCLVKVLTPAEQLSDVRADELQQRIHNVFCHLFHEDSGVVAVIMFELDFDNYLNNGGGSTKDKADKKQKSPKTQLKYNTSNNTSRAHFDDDRLAHNGHNPTDQAATALEADLSLFNRPRDLERAFQRGRFDILIISLKYGIIIFEVKAIGDVFSLSEDLQTIGAQYAAIRKKIERSLKQLEKEERAVKYMLQDLVEPARLSVTKGLIFPNLERRTLRAAIIQDQTLVQDFCQCFGTKDKTKKLEDALEHALERCILSDQLPPVGHSLFTNDDIINQLRTGWWEKLTDELATGAMEYDLYESIVARLCGPATKQYVTTAHNSRAEVSTLNQAVKEASRCFTDLVFTAEQLKTVRLNCDPLVFVTGPPCTGKTMLLVLKAKQWLHDGKAVLVVSLWEGSEAVSSLIYQKIQSGIPDTSNRPHLILSKQGQRDIDDIIRQIGSILPNQDRCPKSQNTFHPMTTSHDWSSVDLTTDGCEASEGSFTTDVGNLEIDGCSMDSFTPSAHQSNFHQVGPESRKRISFRAIEEYRLVPLETSELNRDRHAQPATNQNKQEKVYLVMDEAPWFLDLFLQELEATLGRGRFVIWAASSFSTLKPRPFVEVALTQNLRCPPVIVREMTMRPAYTMFARHSYTSLDSGVLSGMPSPTDGPPVKRIHHQSHQEGNDVWHCEECGRAVAKFLTDQLLIGHSLVETVSKSQDTLRFSDVLISGYLPRLEGVTVDESTRYDHAEGSMEVEESSGHSPANCSTASQRHTPGFITGLQQGGVTPEIIIKGDEKSTEKLVFPEKWDRVQIAEPESIMGLERPVVVVIGTTDIRTTYPRYVDPWFDVMARCTSLLVIVGDVEHSLNTKFGNLKLKSD